MIALQLAGIGWGTLWLALIAVLTLVCIGISHLRSPRHRMSRRERVDVDALIQDLHQRTGVSPVRIRELLDDLSSASRVEVCYLRPSDKLREQLTRQSRFMDDECDHLLARITDRCRECAIDPDGLTPQRLRTIEDYVCLFGSCPFAREHAEG